MKTKRFLLSDFPLLRDLSEFSDLHFNSINSPELTGLVSKSVLKNDFFKQYLTNNA